MNQKLTEILIWSDASRQMHVAVDGDKKGTVVANFDAAIDYAVSRVGHGLAINFRDIEQVPEKLRENVKRARKPAKVVEKKPEKVAKKTRQKVSPVVPSEEDDPFGMG